MPLQVDFALAKDWIDDCERTHTLCSRSSDAGPPSRLLHLQAFDDSPDIRLAVEVKDHVSYATLSHCWGASQPLRLTQSTNEQFKERITYNSLPRTFQDAVTATRSLGLRYLWIDSLCIKQDDVIDWEEQCARMGQIYKDSFVTIAGPAAFCCDSGFLHPRRMLAMVPVKVSNGDLTDDIILSHRGTMENLYELAPEENSPLATRAWVLQERLLSRRVLYFGTRGMYLECFGNVRFESCHYPTNWDILTNSMITKSVFDQLGTWQERLFYWSHLVEDYSSLSLTKSTDRLPALSGIASEFQQATNFHYVVGLWREDIPRGLAWFTPYYTLVEDPRHISGSDYLAPSWSWAAAKYPVIYNNALSEFLRGLEILEITVTVSGLDPFGRVDNGYIKLRGKIRTVFIRELPDSLVRDRRTLYVYSDKTSELRHARYEPDDLCHVPGPEFSVLLLYLGRYMDQRVFEPSVALAVEPLHGSGDAYKRIGMVHGDLLRGPVSNSLEYAFGDSQETYLTLF